MCEVLYSMKTRKWKLVDFGISGQATTMRAVTTRYSRGTSSYRAPELLQSENPYFTNRTDIWALGCILYELVSSRKLFNGDWTTLQFALADSPLLIAVEPPSLTTNEIWASLVALIREMVQIAPHHRPSAKVVHDRFTTFSYQLSHPLANIAPGGESPYSGMSSSIVQKSALGDKYETESEKVYEGVAASFAERLLAHVEEYGEDGKSADLCCNLGDALYSQGRLEDAQREFKRAIHTYEEEFGEDDVMVGDAVTKLARVYQDLGELADAIEQFDRAVRIYGQRLGSQHQKTAGVMESLAHVYGEYAKFRRRGNGLASEYA